MTEDSLDPLSVSNAVLSQYADQYLEYDAARRVKKESVNGGSYSYSFTYTESTHADDYKHWKVKTVESRPDGSQMTVYTNFIGQVLIKDLSSSGDHWIEYREYDSDGRQIVLASPSAVLSYNDTSADLDVSLRTNAGLIQLADYYTTSGSGAAAGYLQVEKVKEGSGGSEVELRRFEYATRTAGDITVHPISKQIAYRHDNGTGAIETSFAFTWHTATVQVEQRTTTLPAVATSQNGSGTSATRKEVFDDHGYLIWSMDERGFITHQQYDLPTGAVVQRIDDVDTGVVSGAPSGWFTPSGGGLNLVTDYEVDDRGRQTEGLGPTHTIDLGGTATAVRSATWTVRKDGEHEVWVGRGYAKRPNPSGCSSLDGEDCKVTIAKCKFQVERQKDKRRK